MSTLSWKINRLRAMGLGEIKYRIRQVVQAGFEANGWGLALSPPKPCGVAGKSWIDAFPLQGFPDDYVKVADQLLEGYFNVFSLKKAFLGFPPNWNADPRTGVQAPLVFGKKINYRDEAIVGDIKYLWEPNRHLELVTLAQAWLLTGNEKYAYGCRILLESWFDRCTYPLGPNWVSSLEHAVRLVNWAFAWHLLGGDKSCLFLGSEGQAFRRRWLDSIYQHCHFISGHFSRYSSANNHLLGEYMGLFVASVTWPLWTDSIKWCDLARKGFQEQALLQNAPDGVNLEQGVWYHHEVADMMLICLLVGRANGLEFSAGFRARLEAMLEFVASIMDYGGNVPMIGDSDDAVMVRFSPTGGNVYRSLLATGAVLFGRGDFKAKAGRFDDKSRWMLGDTAAERYAAIPIDNVTLPVRREFPEGGYWLLGDRFETGQEVRLLADAGPLGYLSIAAHGHADALSFTLSVAGKEILIDPGTYAYHTQKKWRDYFRGTSAHNTVRVDGLDQSEIGGNFLWLHHANARCHQYRTNSTRDEWVGSHDGYMRLAQAVRHRRRIMLDKVADSIRVEDILEGKGRHDVEIFWHFAESCEISEEANTWCARCGGAWAEFHFHKGLSVRLVKGSEEPALGWISRKFDEKQQVNAIVCEGRTEAGKSLVTEIRYGADG